MLQAVETLSNRRRPYICDGTSGTVASGYHVIFSGDCSGVKGTEEQYGVGLAIRREIVKQAGKDSIAIDVPAQVF